MSATILSASGSAHVVVSTGRLPEDVISARTQVCIANIRMDGSAHIYINNERDMFHDFHHTLNEQVNKFFDVEDSDATLKESTVRKGEHCLLYDDRDCLWYRGYVDAVKPTTMCVRYIDYGSTRYVSWNHVHSVPKKLLPYFTALPAQAICVYLNLTPDDSVKAFQYSKRLRSERFRCAATNSTPGGTSIVTLVGADNGMSLPEFLSVLDGVSNEFRDKKESKDLTPIAASPSRAPAVEQLFDSIGGAEEESAAEPELAAKPEQIQSNLDPHCPEFLPVNPDYSSRFPILTEKLPSSEYVTSQSSDSCATPLDISAFGEGSLSDDGEGSKGFGGGDVSVGGEGRGGHGAGIVDVGDSGGPGGGFPVKGKGWENGVKSGDGGDLDGGKGDVRRSERSYGSNAAQYGNAALPKRNFRDSGPPPTNNRWQRDEHRPPPRFQRTVCPVQSIKDNGKVVSGEGGKVNKSARTDVYVPPALRNAKAKDMADILNSRVTAERRIEPDAPSLLKEERDCLPLWVEASGDFFVMLEESAADFDALTTRLEAFVEKALTTFTDLPEPSVGVWVAAPFEGTHYRGIVKELKDDKVLVFFVDYGNTEEIAWKEAKLLPPELQQPNPFAIHVKLHGVGTMKEAEALALSLRVEAASKIRCRFVSFEGPKFLEKYEVVITQIDGLQLHIESGVQQRHEESDELKPENVESAITSATLAIASVAPTSAARPPPSPLPSDVPADITEALLASPKRVAPASGTPIECRITSFNSCKSFWIQLCSAGDPLSQLKFGTEDGGELNPMTISPGVHCLVRAEDGFWYRARVLQIFEGPKAGLALTKFPSPQVRVRFIDFGNERAVPLHPPAGTYPHIRSLPENLSTSLPVVAHHCYLSGFQDFKEDGELLQKATECFDRMVDKDSVKMVRFICDGGPGSEDPSRVTLTIDGKDVGECILASIASDNAVDAHTIHSTTQPNVSSSIREPTTLTPSSSVTSISVAETCVGWVDDSKVEKIPIGEMCKAYCSHMDGIDSVYFQNAANESLIDKVIAKVKELYEDPRNHLPVPDPKPDDKGVAMYMADEEFYRCVVKKRTGDSLNVKFVDFGNTSDVVSSGLLKLHPSVAKIKPLAQGPFRLFPENFDVPHLEILKKHLVADEDTYNIVLKGDNLVEIRDQGGECVNEAVMRDILTESAKNPTPEKESAIVESSSATPSSTPLVSTSKPSTSCKSLIIDAVSVAIPTTDLSDPSSVAPVPITSPDPPSESLIDPTSITPEPQISSRIERCLSLEFASFSFDSCQKVEVTFGDTPDEVFFCISSNVPNVNPFIDGIAELYANENVSSFRTIKDPRVGDIGIVVWADDSSAYRARITNVQNGFADVLFIDFGNRDKVPVADLIELDARLQVVPPIAIGPFCIVPKPVSESAQRYYNDHIYVDERAFTAKWSPEGSLVEMLDENGNDVLAKIKGLNGSGDDAKETSIKSVSASDGDDAQASAESFQCDAPPLPDESAKVAESICPRASTPQPSSAASPAVSADSTRGVTPNPTPVGTPKVASPSQTPNASLLAEKMGAVTSSEKDAPSSVADDDASFLESVDVNSSSTASDVASLTGTKIENSTAIPSPTASVIVTVESVSPPPSDNVSTDSLPTVTTFSLPPLPEAMRGKKPLCPVGKSLKFSLSEFKSPAEFYIDLEENNELNEAMTEYLDKAERFPLVDDLTMGDYCVAKYSEDEYWYRARVTGMSISDDEGPLVKKLQLQFIDWGNEEEIPLSGDRVRQMPPCIAELSPLIYRCSLTGLSSLEGGSQWGEDANNYCRKFMELPSFEDRANCDLLVFATKCGSSGVGGVDYRVRIDSPETKSIVAKKMIEKGFAKETSG